MDCAPCSLIYPLRNAASSISTFVFRILETWLVKTEGFKNGGQTATSEHTMAFRPKSKKTSKRAKDARAVRTVRCADVMQHPNALLAADSMATVVDMLTKHDWDHVFIVDDDGAPLGRIHAVDLLKMIARKTVNRDIAWMHSIPAQQLLTHPPLTVNTSTPLLKAGALMLTHDLNQLGVVDDEGSLVGVVGHNTVARVLPRFIL